MRIEESFEIGVPIQRMFDEINNVERIGYCVAGVKQVTALGPDESKWKVEARAGFMARTFNLTGRIIERRPPEYIAFTGNGQDLELSGRLVLSALSPTRTRCEAVVDASVVGPLAPMVEMMAKGPQQALIRETIENLRKRLESADLDESTGSVPRSVPLPASAGGARSGLVSRFGDWIRSLFQRR